MYFTLSFTFNFFKKKIGYSLNTVKNFGYFFVQIHNNVYGFPIKNLEYGFLTMKFSSIFWLFFLCIHDSSLENSKNFKCSDSVHFWNFLFYFIVKGYILFGFKSVLVVNGFWPKYLYTPEKLFCTITSSTKDYKNPKQPCNKKHESSNLDYKFSNISKKKNTPFLNIFYFFKNAVYFSVNNFIKLFIFLNSKMYTIFFIRKQKFFNKGRYSRNRQLYRTGVYWCIYVNILAVFGLNYLFYKFTVTFSLYWWLFFVLLVLFVAPYFFKSSLHSYFKNLFLFKEYINYTNIIFDFTFFFNIYNKLDNELSYFVESVMKDFY